MEIEYIAIDAIKPYERNPRKNNAAVDAVAASIREFGFQQPIVCDLDGLYTSWSARKTFLYRC